MSFSPGLFFTCFIISFFLIEYLHIILHHDVIFSDRVIKFSLIGILIILIRMAIPVNFPFTYSVYSYHFLPGLTEFTRIRLSKSGMRIADFMLIIWFAITFILLTKLIFQYIRFQKYLSHFYIESDGKLAYLFTLLQNYYKKPIRIAVIKKAISPAITGLFKPTLILPDIINLTDKELEYICSHEIAHYKQHHMWLTLLMEIVCRIHWWNPLVYYMKKEYALFLEISNDSFLIQSIPAFNTTAYAELVIKTAKRLQKTKQPVSYSLMTFAINNPSILETRINFILNNKKGTKYIKKSLSVFCYSIICLAVFLSIFITPEASFRKLEPAEENGVMQINEENAYILETENGYSIYFNGEYLIDIDTIPEDLQDIPITKKGGLYHEK